VTTFYAPSSRLIWSLTNTKLGTTITADGNSGGYTPGVNLATAVDLRDITDVWLSVYVKGAVSGGAPSLVANLDVYDAQGNLFPAVLSTVAITATTTGKSVSGGLHSGGANALVLPAWGRVSWTAGTTPSFAGVEISLFGR
jgi:hypothetical protein